MAWKAVQTCWLVSSGSGIFMSAMCSFAENHSSLEYTRALSTEMHLSSRGQGIISHVSICGSNGINLLACKTSGWVVVGSSKFRNKLLLEKLDNWQATLMRLIHVQDQVSRMQVGAT